MKHWVLLAGIISTNREQRYGHLFDPGLGRGWRVPGDPPPPEFLRLGVQFADGSIVTNLKRPPFPEPDGEPTGPLLVDGGGGGGGRRYDFGYPDRRAADPRRRGA